MKMIAIIWLIYLKFKTNFKRVEAKNYFKQQVYTLLRKAKANIDAVDKGHFGVVH